MIIPNIHVDDHGHSYFGESDLVQSGDPTRRVSARNQDVPEAGSCQYDEFFLVDEHISLGHQAGLQSMRLRRQGVVQS